MASTTVTMPVKNLVKPFITVKVTGVRPLIWRMKTMVFLLRLAQRVSGSAKFDIRMEFNDAQ